MHTLNRDIEGGDIWKKSKKDNSGTEFGHTRSKTGHPIGKLVNKLHILPITGQKSKLAIGG